MAKKEGIIGLVQHEFRRADLTKLCRSCGRPLDDYARFCDRCGLVQPLQPAPQIQQQYAQPVQPVPQIQYQYPQPPQPTQVSPVLPQPVPVTVSPAKPPRAGILGRIRRRGKQPIPMAMPVAEIAPQQPPRPEAEAVAAPSRPAVKVTRWALRPLGRKLNYVGILGGIVAFVSLIMPWWTATASIPVMGLGNSTAIDFPLYLYEPSASVLANPPSQVVIFDLWFCWIALALVTLAGILAVVGSIVTGRGKLILLIGGVVALLSIVLFAIGLETELSATGSGLDLFKTASGTWGTLTAYLSFGFWGALVAGATMLVAAMRSGVMTTAFPVTVQPRAPEAAPTEPRVAETAQGPSPVVAASQAPAPPPSGPAAVQAPAAVHVGRPRGIMFLIAYCGLLAICAIASIPFASSLVEGIRQLPLSAVGIGVPDMAYLWGLLVFLAVVDLVIAFGLLKRKKLARTVARILSVLAVVSALIVICLIAVLLISPNVLGVGTPTALTSSSVLYAGLTIVVLLGVALPLVVFRYLSRPTVKEYFAIVK